MNCARRILNTSLLFFQALSRNSTGHLTAREFQDLFDVLVKVTRRRQRPAMSYVQNFVLRNIQVLVAQKVFDYVSDFVVAVNVVVISVRMRNTVILGKESWGTEPLFQRFHELLVMNFRFHSF